ncbi:MAG: hypothetical protein EA399_06210 [Desulfovibrionales bacterium]|nr:MAG: hypothetical protein EA399_06210 [Desulfovibrionales bacterium]
MKPIIVMALGVLLGACAPRTADQTWMFADHAPKPMHHEVDVTVAIALDPVMEYADVCRQLATASREQGVEDLLHTIVGQAPVLRPAGRLLTENLAEHQEQVSPEDGWMAGFSADATGEACDPWLDPVTGMVSQRSLFEAQLVPEPRFGGVIDALQDNKTMGGMLSRAYVTLWGDPVGSEPVPVVIVQQSRGLDQGRGQGLVQVVGSGLITQLADSFGQMRILESTREIFPGDLFFQLQVRSSVRPMVGDLLPLAPEGDE